MAKPKPTPQPTNGPYSWGNGPRPQGWIRRILKGKKGK